MYIIDTARFHEALKAKGYGSLGEFARDLGIHRNTVHYYLAERPVFPDKLDQMLHALELSPDKVLIEKRGVSFFPHDAIASLIDELHATFPDVTLILFGSRVQGRAYKYSDWDIGVYRREGLSHQQYRRISQFTDELAEDLPFFVDVVNLNRADQASWPR